MLAAGRDRDDHCTLGSLHVGFAHGRFAVAGRAGGAGPVAVVDHAEDAGPVAIGARAEGVDPVAVGDHAVNAGLVRAADRAGDVDPVAAVDHAASAGRVEAAARVASVAHARSDYQTVRSPMTALAAD